MPKIDPIKNRLQSIIARANDALEHYAVQEFVPMLDALQDIESDLASVTKLVTDIPEALQQIDADLRGA